MKKIIFILSGCLIAINIFAQKVTISGYVEDISSGEKLIGAAIFDKQSLKGTTTNIYGFYSLTIDSGQADLRITYVGYSPYQNSLSIANDTFLKVSMKQENVLKEVVVTATKGIQEQTQMSSINIPMKQIELLPAFMGEKDILKSIQLLPGVQSGSEGSSGLYVRGGGPDQNLILLDGVPVYNASHLFGFFSVFNSSALNNVEIIKGGFPARFGGRVSSVLDIRMKEGNMKKLSGEASIGLISSKLTLEAPIIKDKTSFIISGRRTYIDILAQPFIKRSANQNRSDSKDGNGVKYAGYFFYDLNAKINHKFSDKSRLYLSTYMGNDKAYSSIRDSYSQDTINFVENSDNNLEWGNITTALRYNQIISNKLFANITATYSRYRFNIGFLSSSEASTKNSIVNNSIGYTYLSGIYDWGGKIDFDFLPNPNHYVRFGIGETYHTFTPGVNTFSLSSGSNSLDTTFGSTNIFAHEISAFIEDDIKIGGRLKINPGIHFSKFLVNDTTYNNLQPRLAVNFLINEHLALKGSFARMAQYLHLLTNGTIGLPTDLWVPVTDSVPPIEADQFALGLAYNLNDKYEISIEGYYKEMKNLIEYKDGASFFGSSENWDKKIEIGNGYAYGVELFLQKKVGRTSGWIGYTLSWSTRQFDNLNFGKTFAYKYDRRHDLSIALIHEVKKRVGKKKKRLDLGMTWVYGTGNSLSLPISTYRAYDAYTYDPWGEKYITEIDNYVDRNSFKEPSYHRMDLSATFTNDAGKAHKSWNISVYNLYNRNNPFYLYFDYNEENVRVLKQLSLFPIIPSVSYSIKF